LITAVDRDRQSTEPNRIGHDIAVAYHQRAADALDVWIVQSLGADFGTDSARVSHGDSQEGLLTRSTH